MMMMMIKMMVMMMMMMIKMMTMTTTTTTMITMMMTMMMIDPSGRPDKGALDNLSLIPEFFLQKLRFYVIRIVYLCSDCVPYLTSIFNSITKLL